MTTHQHHEKRQFADSERGRERRDVRRAAIARKRQFCDIYANEIKG